MSNRSFIYIIIMYVLTACVGAKGTSGDDAERRDWPIFRGSASLCGYTGFALPDAPRLLWSTTTRTRTVAAPIVYNDIVYTMNRKGELRGYTLEGDSCCGYDLGTAVEASFIAVDSMLYVGRIDGFVTALRIGDLQTITPQWEYETLGQISGSANVWSSEPECEWSSHDRQRPKVNAVGNLLLVGSYDGNMYMLETMTGRKTGQFETGYYINGTAAVWKDYMMFGGCDAWVRVVDISTGVMTDSLKLGSYVPASPAILDGVAVACDYNGNVYEMTLQDGKISGHRKLLTASEDMDGQEGGVVSTPTLTQDAVYFLSGDRHICCIDRQSGKMRWKKILRGITGECAPLVAQDKVLACTKDGHVSILDCENGAELWHYEAGEQIIASPAILADRFFILTARGTLLCFS